MQDVQPQVAQKMPHPVLLSQMIPNVKHSLMFGIEMIFTKISDKVDIAIC